MFPLPLLPLPFPLLFPSVGIAERPIPVDTRLKPDPPGLFVDVNYRPTWIHLEPG